MPTAQVSPQEEQEKLRDTAMKQVRDHGFQMKTSLDNNQLMDALKHASTMLLELRTSLLSPRNYYELYMSVCDQLQHLEQFLLIDFQKNKAFGNLYELVQYAGNIVPRLYLLCTVGAVFMKTKEGSRKDILKDCVEMCRGVQHPLRGLFLRNYLLQSTRNQLPDLDNIENVEEGSIEDSVSFILQNFAEMNKLWVRMQHQGHTKEKSKREKERQELKILVGTNLVRLSELEGVNAELYKKTALPSVLEQVVSCHDAIAQEYLMECIIQVFPEEFHLATLNLFLKACEDLEPTVNVKEIIIALITRFVDYSRREDSPGIPANIALFDIFSQEVAVVIQSRDSMSPEDIASLQSALVDLALKVYPDRIHYVDKVLQHIVELFDARDITAIVNTTSHGQKLIGLVRNIIESYKETLTLLQLEHFPALVKLFGFRGRKSITLTLAETLLDNSVIVPSAEEVDQIMSLLSPLLCDQPDQPDEVPDQDMFDSEQELVARLVHHFKVDSPDQQYTILKAIYKQFSNGGENRMRHTLLPVVFAAYQLVFKYRSIADQDDRWEKKCEKILDFCCKTILTLTKIIPDLALRLFLQGALAADRIGLEKEAYEFVIQAFTVFEEDISDSKAQVASLVLIIATFEQMHNLGEDNHETLRTNSTRSASKLLKKPDQCRTVATCAHLFWSGRVKLGGGEAEECHDDKRVSECLKKCCRITNQCMDKIVQVQLLTEILNFCMLFYEKGSTQLTPSFMKSLIDKIKEESAHLNAEENAEILKHFQNTLDHIRYMQGSGSEQDYKGLVV
jgi:vacuolar protein sorting-associated protein 35